MENTTGRADRKLDAPEETLDLNAYIIDQELGDEEVGGGLTDAVVSQEPPVLHGLPEGLRRVVGVSISANRFLSEEFAHLMVG